MIALHRLGVDADDRTGIDQDKKNIDSDADAEQQQNIHQAAIDNTFHVPFRTGHERRETAEP